MPPKNSFFFQRHCDIISQRNNPRGKVASRSGGGNGTRVSVTDYFSAWWTIPFHLLPDSCFAVLSIGVQLDSHRIRMKSMEKYLDGKPVLVPEGLNCYFSQSQRRPLLLEILLPFREMHAKSTVLSDTLLVVGRCRNVILLGVTSHRAARRKIRC